MDGIRGRGRVQMRGNKREQGGGRGQGRGRGIGRGRPGGGVGHAQRRRQPNLCNEIRATIVDNCGPCNNWTNTEGGWSESTA